LSAAILWVGFNLAVLDWIAVGYRLRWLEYIAKPAVMLLILVWLCSHSGLYKSLSWFVAGAIFSLVGDILLMLPRQRFVHGMLLFSLAYISYGAGFATISLHINPALLVMAGFVLFPAVTIYQRLSIALVAHHQPGLVIPTLVYSGILSLMLITACSSLTGQDWELYPAVLVSLGALLLFLSDTFLAWNRYIKPLRLDRLTNIVPYHLGQLFVAYGIILNFGS
jgi:uncharacterized membrane protein YhhN